LPHASGIGSQVSRGPHPDLGVSDGTRTRDTLDHNQVLYQLSYTHHSAPTFKLPAPSCSVLHRLARPALRK
jgi:hypothetical protein